MRILYLSQYFFPETGATQIRAYEMAKHWVQLGHQVTLIAEIPNHPTGIVPLEYRGKLYQRDLLDGIEVIRVWVKASPQKNFRNRLLFYLSYMLTSTLAGLSLVNGHYDLIFASSPPLFVGGAALALHYLKRIPMVFEVRDLWPESAVALGELNNPMAINLSTRLEETCYRVAKKIVVVTDGIRHRLASRGIAADKIALIPNGADTELFRFNPAVRDKIRSELGLQDKFVAIFAGMHGIAYDLATLVEAARLLREVADISILLIGEGPKKAETAALIQQHGLTNISMLPEQPFILIPSFLSAADVAVIPLRKLELFKATLPVRMFDAWACNLPVILGVEGEARELLEKAEGGLFIPPEDPQELAAALMRLRASPDERQKMGESGRAFTVQNYSRHSLAGKLITELEAMSASAPR